MVEKLILTQRQWNQIKAALRFWVCVEETSRIPPIKHPKVQSFFETIPALSLQEIEELTARSLVSETLAGTPVLQIAQTWSLPVRRIHAQLKRMGIKPIERTERADLYSSGDVEKACQVLRKRDVKHIRRYQRSFLDAIFRKTKTSGDPKE